MKHFLNLFAVKLIETQKYVSLFVSKTHDETRFLYTHNLIVYVTLNKIQLNSTVCYENLIGAKYIIRQLRNS